MAIEKTINIKVNTGDATSELNSLDSSLKKVDKTAESTNKSVDSVASNGGAIAILDQITGGLATRLKDAYEASKLFNFSLKGMKTALIATGIGAFVVALGLVVAYWDDIVEFVQETNKKLQEQLDLTKRTEETLNLELGLLEKKLELSGKQGVANEELQKQRVELIKKIQAQKDEEIRLLGIQAEKIKASAFELTLKEKLIKATLNLGAAGAGDSYILDKQVESLNEYKDIQDAITKAKTENIDLSLKLYNLEEKTTAKKREQLQGLGFDALVENERKRNEALFKLSQDRLTQVQADEDAETKIRLDAEIGRIGKKAELAEAEYQENQKRKAREFQIEEQLGQAKVVIAETTLSLIGGLAKENSALAKGVAVAQAVMSTYQGVNKALAETTDFTPTQTLRFANAAAVGVAGILNVSKILSTNPTQATAGNVSGSRGAASAPSFNLVQGTGSNQIAQTLGNQKEPLKAYVVSSDVSTAESLNRNIIDGASIGGG